MAGWIQFQPYSITGYVRSPRSCATIGGVCIWSRQDGDWDNKNKIQCRIGSTLNQKKSMILWIVLPSTPKDVDPHAVTLMFRSVLAALGDRHWQTTLASVRCFIAAFAILGVPRLSKHSKPFKWIHQSWTHDRTVRDCDIAVNLLKKVERVERGELANCWRFRGLFCWLFCGKMLNVDGISTTADRSRHVSGMFGASWQCSINVLSIDIERRRINLPQKILSD